MARSIVLSNGELCVALDDRGMVRDIYYPYVGHEDHVRGHYLHRVGVWIDGRMSWLSEDPAWDIRVGSEEDALASVIRASHAELQIELAFKDIVYNEAPVFLRRVVVTNKSAEAREIKLYFAHQFEIYKSHGSDTAYFDPLSHSVIHYKGHRVFLIRATLDGEPFQDYATGRMNFQGKEGSHRDADDGALSKNPIEHGPADSVIGLYAHYDPGQAKTAHYWIAAGQSIEAATELNTMVAEKSPEYLIKTVSHFWKAWVESRDWSFYKLAAEHVSLFKKSLMYMRANVDQGGGIIASVDSDMLQYGLDTYCYVWPRDAAYTAIALDRAGDTFVSRRFFGFCRETITEEGFFRHKYLPDRALGSSWHPWVVDGRFQLPIQEDETALPLIAFCDYYIRSRDIEYLEEMYAPLVEKAANFLVRYRSLETGLPEPSYDLWERKRGTSTFTAAAVFAALEAAAYLSSVLGKDEHEMRYREAAKEVKAGIMEHLWDEKRGMFVNMIDSARGTVDATVDISSVYGVFSFGVLPKDDPKLARAFENTVRTLSHGISAGGIARFEDDDYYRIDTVSPGNPWVITTLWYAEYLLANAKQEHDFDRVRDIFSWVAKHAHPSGVLSEQLHPQTGHQVGATPLTWAHGAYVMTILAYLDRLEELGICPAENPAR